jgi:hypothetical protein
VLVGWLLLTGAIRAEADDRKVGEAGLVAEQLPDPVPDRLELRRNESFDRPAALAREEFAITATDQRVQTRSVAEVNVAHQSVSLECLEVSVDGCGIQLGAGCDALGRSGLVCRKQRLQHKAARSREPQPAGPQRVDGAFKIIEGQPRNIGRFGHDPASMTPEPVTLAHL